MRTIQAIQATPARIRGQAQERARTAPRHGPDRLYHARRRPRGPARGRTPATGSSATPDAATTTALPTISINEEITPNKNSLPGPGSPASQSTPRQQTHRRAIVDQRSRGSHDPRCRRHQRHSRAGFRRGVSHALGLQVQLAAHGSPSPRACPHVAVLGPAPSHARRRAGSPAPPERRALTVPRHATPRLRRPRRPEQPDLAARHRRPPFGRDSILGSPGRRTRGARGCRVARPAGRQRKRGRGPAARSGQQSRRALQSIVPNQAPRSTPYAARLNLARSSPPRLAVRIIHLFDDCGKEAGVRSMHGPR